MKVLDVGSRHYTSIAAFGSRVADAVELAAGAGGAHVHLVRFGSEGEIGPHEAGFGQLFVVLSGDGWVAGPDGRRLPITAGEVAYVRRGEVHSKGATRAMTACIVQVRDLELAPGLGDEA